MFPQLPSGGDRPSRREVRRPAAEYYIYIVMHSQRAHASSSYPEVYQQRSKIKPGRLVSRRPQRDCIMESGSSSWKAQSISFDMHARTTHTTQRHARMHACIHPSTRHSGRQTGREADRHTGTQAHRHAGIHAQTHIHASVHMHTYKHVPRYGCAPGAAPPPPLPPQR